MRCTLRFLVLAADALLVVLFLIGYAARYVHPRYAWWADLLAVGLPYMSMALILATVLAASARRWRLLGGHFVLVGLIVLRFAPASGPNWSGSPRPGDLTLMTYNLPQWWSSRSEEETTRTLLRLARRTGTDLLSLQEMRLVYRPDGRLRGAPFVGAFVDSLGFRRRYPHRPAVLRALQSVMSRVPVESVEMFELSVANGEPPAQVTRVHFRWQGREAVLYNVHLRSFGMRKPWVEERLSPFTLRFWTSYLRQYRAAYQARAHEAEQLRRLIERETLPVIVTGDFNSTMHSWVYRHLARGLQDAFRVAGTRWGATYHAEFPLVRIDFILVGPAFEVVSARVLDDVGLSDHRPVVATLRWR